MEVAEFIKGLAAGLALVIPPLLKLFVKRSSDNESDLVKQVQTRRAVEEVLLRNLRECEERERTRAQEAAGL